MNRPYSTPDAWWAGPERVYQVLSRAALADHASDLSDRLVLDLGAGVGATSTAVGEAGGRVIALDSSSPMLHHLRQWRPPAIVADACVLPLADQTMDATVAAFVVSHVADPLALMSEAGRVTKPDGLVVVVSFARSEPRPAVAVIVDDLVRARGWVAPPWFRRLKDEREPAVADPERLESMALAAGLRSPVVATLRVDTLIDDPDDLVSWRLGSPGIAAFVDGLSAMERQRLRAEAVDRLGPSPQPLVFDLRVLSSRADATRRSVPA
jgi:SAM-dependent methyltransferase